MTVEEHLELQTFDLILNNEFIVERLQRDDEKTLERMYNRSAILTIKFIEEYNGK